MQKQELTSFVEPKIHTNNPVESVLLIPFWYSLPKKEFIEKLKKMKCDTDTPLWNQTEEMTSVYPLNKTYSNFLKENWYSQKGQEAQITHLSIPIKSIQYIFKRHEFYAFTDKVPKSIPKDVDKRLSSLKDLPFKYKIEKITLEVFPYGVACLSIHVVHRTSLSISRSLSLLRRLDSQIVLHSFYDTAYADSEKFSPPKGILKEYRSPMPATNFRLGDSNHDAPVIKPICMTDLCSTLLQEEEESICQFYSDAEGLLYSMITTTNKIDEMYLNQWLYYLSTANIFPDHPEEWVPFHTAESLEQYDLHTFHKREGLYIRFCREGVLSLGMVPEDRAESYLCHNWKGHWFKKYLLIYKQVLAEEMIVIGFYREARGWFQNEKYRWNYNHNDQKEVQEEIKEKKLTSLIDLSERMHRFLMSFRLLDCGHCTDLNAFFDSSRDIMSLDQRIKILRESMAQIVQQISYLEKEQRHNMRSIRHQDSLNKQNKTLKKMESLLENQEKQAQTQTETLKKMEVLQGNQKEHTETQTQTLNKLKELLESQRTQNEIQDKRHKRAVLDSRIFQLIGLVFLPITAVTGWMGMNKNSASSGFNPEGVEVAPIIASITWIIIIGICILYFIHRYFEYNLKKKEKDSEESF